MDAITIKNLNKTYKDFSLQDISFSVPKGSVMGFVGENGAGKTTTLKAILNLISYDSGNIEIFGLDSKKNEKIVFYIVLFLIYIIIQISRLFNGGNYFSNINYLFYILAFIAWGGYYNYFYKMGYIKYSIFFYLFSVYYKCLDAVIYRILFFAITGNVISSKESLLVPHLESIKIQIYSNLIIILIYLIFSFFRKSIKLISQDKRNYVYLLFALLVNTMNMLVNYVLKKLERFGSLDRKSVV